MKKKVRLVKEFGFLWRETRGESKLGGKWIESIKIRKLRHKNDTENTMGVQE